MNNRVAVTLLTLSKGRGEDAYLENSRWPPRTWTSLGQIPALSVWNLHDV